MDGIRIRVETWSNVESPVRLFLVRRFSGLAADRQLSVLFAFAVQYERSEKFRLGPGLVTRKSGRKYWTGKQTYYNEARIFINVE
jgi:hypothetical protein